MLYAQRMTKSVTPPATAQSLGALLKSVGDIMRKDKGFNGDLDRLPKLAWIMFLKILDDPEIQREGEVKPAAKKFKSASEPTYRWRDGATPCPRHPRSRLQRRSMKLPNRK